MRVIIRTSLEVTDLTKEARTFLSLYPTVKVTSLVYELVRIRKRNSFVLILKLAILFFIV